MLENQLLFVVLVSTLDSVRNVMILVIGLLILSFASHSGWTFIEMFMIVIEFHFSILCILVQLEFVLTILLS